MVALRASDLPYCLLLMLVAACPGCASGRVNLWPFYFHEVREVQTDSGPQVLKTTEVLYPFFTREADPGGNWHALRPLYNYEREAEGGRYRVQYLWPLGLHFKDGDNETQHRFFPLFHYIKSWSAGTKRHAVHAHLLQLLRWGRDDQWGPYVALFPLAGITHGVIGDTWSFVLFPLYSHYRHGDYVRDDLPWPFLGRGRTPDGKRKTYRFWPLYVYERKERPAELRVTHRVLWMLVRGGLVDRRGDYYHTVLAVAPLFSTIRTWDRKGNLVAYELSILGVGFRRDLREEPQRTGWTALWRLVRKSEEPGSDQFRFFPFYSRTTVYAAAEKKPEQNWTRHRILWPLLWIDSDRRNPKVHKKGVLLAPFYWHYTDVYSGEDGDPRKGRRITLWPLFTWERGPDGDQHWWVVSHGWKDTTKGFKRNYRAFLDFFQYHRYGKGETEARVLGRLYHHRRGRGGRYLSLGGFFTYDSTGEVVGEEGKYVSLLFGLVKCSWTEQKRRWRILYIGLGGGGKQDAEDDDAPTS